MPLSSSELAARRAAARAGSRRRRLQLLAAAGLALAVAVLAIALSGGHAKHTVRTPAAVTVVSTPARQPIPAAQPGKARVISEGPTRREVALTFDDGFCARCAAEIVATLLRTGAHATIFPNGRYAASWEPQAGRIRTLIARGQLTVGNHTFLHGDAVTESPAAFETDLVRDEAWIERAFGVTARPFFRPPYGAYNSSTVEIAGRHGFTKVITWSGTLADSSLRTPGYVLGAIRHWARPGAIILAHANYPATAKVLPQIIAILRARHLRPVTLAELLQPSR